MFARRFHRKISIGLLGYGNFGKLLLRNLAEDFSVQVFDPDPNAFTNGSVEFSSFAQVAKSDVVIIATPVNRLSDVVSQLAPLLKKGALVMDVGSVKVLPAKIMAENLPSHVDIICTHPLFGPQSAVRGLSGLKIALFSLRGTRLAVVTRYLRCLGLVPLLTTAESHDRDMAVAQGLTHLIAKGLSQLEPLPSVLTTRSFDLIKSAAEMVRDDSPKVFAAIQTQNPYAKAVRAKFLAILREFDEGVNTFDT
ncbi:prephenate dehydrogenase/arogenate dehydrogenase family protein [Rhizobium leguminosarum]|uniref:Prephenate/arogenate dehydrogenase domain-containing protein n=2 Tax=Rhizobium leguminosarum TaxID=384 RepID=A0A154IDQ8_RHILE|nr:prephenate dehydrogenase/arogenate dehydrogenase family protein [Rhizobium leguminosarum]KZA98561.1 hypothetical protein A4A59_26440 [Rhizobium leguminosarum]